MKNLQEATERICELKGSQVALDALTSSPLHTLPAEQRQRLKPVFEHHAEVARSVLLHAPISELTIAAFELDVSRTLALLRALPEPAASVEPLLLCTARISTFDGPRALTGASGFFFERDERLFLVTSRHVVFDEPSKHHPDRIEIELHADRVNLTRTVGFSVLLYRKGLADWRQAEDTGGAIDVAVLELDRAAMPPEAVFHAFTPADVQGLHEGIEAGRSISIVGYPLGFHDSLHHLPVVRQAAIASSFGLRFEGHGFFLTDARTHRGTSGAPVVTRRDSGSRSADGLGWMLLGVHSSRFDVDNRAKDEDESLGLNCAWYADVLLALTDKP
jgi:hypothetical protein